MCNVPVSFVLSIKISDPITIIEGQLNAFPSCSLRLPLYHHSTLGIVAYKTRGSRAVAVSHVTEATIVFTSVQ